MIAYFFFLQIEVVYIYINYNGQINCEVECCVFVNVVYILDNR